MPQIDKEAKQIGTGNPGGEIGTGNPGGGKKQGAPELGEF